MANKIIILAVVLLVTYYRTTTATSAATLTAQCADKLQNVMPCLSFANGKAPAPTKQCCDSVEGMKESNPACLCFVIQQIHNGTNPELKSLGIQEARLLQLPSACKIVNASISDCPRLLNLPPNSPDAAIFSSNSTSPSTSAPATGTRAGAGATPNYNSSGVKHGGLLPQLAGSILVTLAVFFYAFPAGHFTLTTNK